MVDREHISDVHSQGGLSCKHFMNQYMRLYTSSAEVELVMALPVQRDLLSCAEHLDHLELEVKMKMDALKDTVQSKTAVPTAQVYVSLGMG